MYTSVYLYPLPDHVNSFFCLFCCCLPLLWSIRTSAKSSSPRGGTRGAGVSSGTRGGGAASGTRGGAGTSASKAVGGAGGARGGGGAGATRGGGGVGGAARGGGGATSGSASAFKRSAVTHLANLKRARVDDDSLRRPATEVRACVLCRRHVRVCLFFGVFVCVCCVFSSFLTFLF